MNLKKIEKNIQNYKLVYYINNRNRRQGELKQYKSNGKLYTTGTFENNKLVGDLIYYDERGFEKFVIKLSESSRNATFDIELYNGKVDNLEKIIESERNSKRYKGK